MIKDNIQPTHKNQIDILKKECIENSDKFSYIVVSMHIYNILCDSNNFHSFFSVNEYTGLTEVGSIFGYKVFLDILMPPNQILLSIDKQSLRDYKIDYLLYGNEVPQKEKRVKIF